MLATAPIKTTNNQLVITWALLLRVKNITGFRRLAFRRAPRWAPFITARSDHEPTALCVSPLYSGLGICWRAIPTAPKAPRICLPPTPAEPGSRRCERRARNSSRLILGLTRGAVVGGVGKRLRTPESLGVDKFPLSGVDPPTN